MSVVTLGELRKGIHRLPPGKRRWLEHDLEEWFQERILPVPQAIASRWGILSAEALDRGRPLPNIDGLLAATAIEHDLTIATRNVKDFAGLGVTVVNPWEA